VTLRGRLTAAFLAVVLGPVLLAALFVGTTATTVGRDRTVERLDHAASTVRTAIGALCRQLQAAADTLAVVPDADRAPAADQLVARGLASGVLITDAAGTPVYRTPALPRSDGAAQPWRDCATAGDTGVVALAAHATTTAADGRPLGTVYAAQLLDAAFVDRLAASSGAAVTLLAGSGADVVHSTEPPDVGQQIATRVAGLSDAVVRTGHGTRYARLLGPRPSQPLPLAVSVPGGDPVGLYTMLFVAVLAVVAVTVVVAAWLARSTTRPLADLAWAAGQVADGELDTRVPVLRQDELGRLASTFNRMTRELQSYVHALTASRDQLRGHLAILGDTLSSTHDLHRILQVILHSALSATGARAGVVLLIDPVDRTLVARCAEGLSGRWASLNSGSADLRVPPGEGILGRVAATGEPRRGIAALDSRLISAGEPRCRTYVAVPICAPVPTGDPLVPGRALPELPAVATAPATLGVLALYDRPGTEEFDDADLLTLGRFAGQVGVAVSNVRVHEEAQRLSLTDPLTGLWNYRYLKESIRREVERANRFGRMLTVLVLDLDHFKEVNDTYGHAAGDTVLAEFARRLRVGLREVDLAFRQGGEEFVLLLPETDGYGGVTVAERLGAAVRDIPVPVDPRHAGEPVHRIPISVSIGIAVYPDHGSTAQQVLDAADDALYAAKDAGRDTCRLASGVRRPVSPSPQVSTHPISGQDRAVETAAPTGATSGPAAGASSGAPGGPHPPRQSRGR
jgi:two-component system cell cycle response regulator